MAPKANTDDGRTEDDHPAPRTMDYDLTPAVTDVAGRYGNGPAYCFGSNRYDPLTVAVVDVINARLDAHTADLPDHIFHIVPRTCPVGFDVYHNPVRDTDSLTEFYLVAGMFTANGFDHPPGDPYLLYARRIDVTAGRVHRV